MTRQDYGTPPEFIRAIEKRFGPIVCDLAARIDNAVARDFLSPEADSLTQPWAQLYPTGTLYLNPPFAHIEPWAKKCAEESTERTGWIVMLVPASVGSLWFHKHVAGKAHWDGIPRMQFIGAEHLYPKDLMLCAFGYGVHGNGYWDWRDDVPAERKPVTIVGMLPGGIPIIEQNWAPPPASHALVKL